MIRIDNSIVKREFTWPLRQDIKVRIRAFVQGVFVAILPAAILVLSQKVGFVATEPWSDYLGFGVVLWGVIAFVLTIDPRFSEKVEAFEKIASVIPRLSKKGK